MVPCGARPVGSCDLIRAPIYSIPPKSPFDDVIYEKIYDVTPQYVVVCDSMGNTGDGRRDLLIGGERHRSRSVKDIGTTVADPTPLTYGYAANPTWTSWTWSLFGLGCCSAGPSVLRGVQAAARATPPRQRGGAMAVLFWFVGGQRNWGLEVGPGYDSQRLFALGNDHEGGSAGYNAWQRQCLGAQTETSDNSVTGTCVGRTARGAQDAYTGNYAVPAMGATYNLGVASQQEGAR